MKRSTGISLVLATGFAAAFYVLLGCRRNVHPGITQFAFTVTYHYLFPQLTMGLAWFLVYWKWQALRTGDD